MATKILFVYNNAFGEYPILYEYCVGLFNLGYEVYYVGVAAKDENFTSPEGIHVRHISRYRADSAWKLSSGINSHSRQIDPAIIHVFHFRWCFLLPLKGFFFTNYLLDVRTLHVADKRGNYSSLTFLKNRITWGESQFYKNCIALTLAIRKILTPSYKKIPIIPLGANTDTLQPPDKINRRLANRYLTNAGDDDLVFIYSGTLSPARRIDQLLHAFSVPESQNVKLVIAGDDKDNPQTIIDLKTMAATLGIANKVLFTGFLPYNELVNYYLGADVGLCYVPQTSYYDLQPPTKLFEYLAAGLVTIATNTSANKNIITNGVNGYLSEDDAQMFGHTMASVLNDYPQTSRELIARGHKTAENYSWKHIINDRIVPQYERILNKPGYKK